MPEKEAWKQLLRTRLPEDPVQRREMTKRLVGGFVAIWIGSGATIKDFMYVIECLMGATAGLMRSEKNHECREENGKNGEKKNESQ